MTSSRSRRNRKRRPFNGSRDDHEATETLAALTTDPADGTTYAWPATPDVIRFEGASAGAMPPAGTQLPSPAPQPVARLRARPAPAAGYAAAATGPQPVIRERPAIGDALALDEEWGPKLTNLPCGHCGATLGADPAVTLERTRTIGYLNWLARQDGWKHDANLIWTCPACQQDEEWKGRQGPLDVHRDVTCQRNHLAAEPRGDCTCPGAVLAVDVMLASEDHLGSRHAGGAR